MVAIQDKGFGAMGKQSSSEIEHCTDILEKTRGLLVISGAGISAESGIPTYRGPGGIYENNPGLPPMLSAEGLAKDPDRIWNHFNELRTLVAGAQPNPAHRILAKWETEQRFPRMLIATQNIDGLHQKAGSGRVSELHGSMWQMACPRTVDYAEDEQFSDDFSEMMSSGGNADILRRWSEENNRTIWNDHQVPFSTIPPYTDPAIRPNVLFFNEDYGNRLLWVEDFIRKGVDTVLVVGCSGGVAVLDRLLRQCRKENPACSIININPHQDCIEHAHTFIHMQAGSAMEQIQTCLK
ncbi:NAD-dependent protein deacylase [Pontiella desulfatans]|uniref:protein acetyllysine N-acetyltransferase n=2 Tax=Pontiella desulfatans TaxID=2750659 RepID=A0A6C2UAF2_PONDE|nr:NAD-dependent protein deacylase [Pontiella desulfatans]